MRKMVWLVLLFGSLSFLVTSTAPAALDGFIGLTNGYFYDTSTGEAWVPHGIAYQTWNRPLGVWQTYEQIDYDLDEIVKMGANSVRIDMVWQHIEGDGATSVAEGDNNFDWEKYDYFVQACEDRGLRIFALIGYQWPPNWFPDDWYTKHPPEFDSEGIYHSDRWQSDIINYEHPDARAQYAEWLGAVSAHFKDSKAIVGWIVGNESGYLGLWSGLLDGYDDWCEAAFRTWCQNKYTTIENCNAAWGTSLGAFSNIVFVEQYRAYGQEGAEWADMVQWREDSIAGFTAVGAVGCKQGDTNHLISYSTVGMQWGEEDWRYHAEDRGKITTVCMASNAPVDFFSVNNYPWSVLGHESQNGHWGISYTKKVAKVPVLYSETGFTSSETMWPGMNEYRQGPLVRNALWESLEAGAIGTHIFSWMDRPYITDREKGFGIVYADRRIKPALWTSKEAYNLMEQVDIHNLLMDSEDPVPDIAFLWTDANDSQYNRYECEMQQIAGALERLGYEPNFLNLQDLADGIYTNYKAVILPRNMRVEDSVPGYTNSVLNFLLNYVLPAGIHVMASADLPGMQDFNGKPRAAFEHEVNELFGIDASNVGGFEAPQRRDEYVSWYWKLIEVDFNTNSSIDGYHCWPQVWKYNDEIEVTDGSVWATLNSDRNKGFEDSDSEVVKWDGTWGNVYVRSGWGWAQDGNNMVQMWGDSGMWKDQPVVPFGRYTHSTHLRSNSDDPLAGGQEAFVAIEWRDKDGNVLSTSESAHLTSATPENSWVEYTVDAVAPANVWTARRIVRIQGSGSGSVYVDHPAVNPAVVVKDHGTAKAGIFLFSAGDQRPDGDLDSQPDVYAWEWRYDYFGAMIRDYFGIASHVSVSGDNAYLCLAEHRTCADGSTLWQVKNYMYDTNYPASPEDPIGGGAPQTFTLTSPLFEGKTIKAFYQSKIIEDNSDGTINLTLAPDGMEILHVYDSGLAGESDYTEGSSDNRIRRGNNARTGVVPGGPQSFPLTGVWTTYVGTGCGSPVVAGDRVFVAGGSYMKCLDARSGELIWTYCSTNDGGGSFNPYGVTVADGVVYGVTKNLSGTNYPNGAVFAVNAGNGTMKWKCEGPRQESGYNNFYATPPAIENGVAYCYVGGIGLAAIDTANGNVLHASSVSGNHYNGPAVVSGKVYQANTQWLYSLNTEDGSTNWSVYISGYCDSTPAVANGKVYIARGSAGEVYVHDADTGARLWATTNYYTSKSSVTVVDGKMYFIGYLYGTSSNALYCFDAETGGEPLWAFPVAYSGYRSPIYADGVLYFGSDKFYAVDADTGVELWSYDGPDTYYDPSVRHGWAFFSDGSRLYAYSDGTAWPETQSSGNELVLIQDSPALVHPLGDKAYLCKIGYDCGDRTDLTLKFAFCEDGDNGDGVTNEVYESLSAPVGYNGVQEFWIWIPDADQNDADYISTTDGGRYHFRAWLEDADTNIVAEAIPVPASLKWGVRPTETLPTAIEKGQHIEIPIEWEDMYEYLPWEVTPMARADAFPDRVAIFRSLKTEAQFPGQLDRVNQVCDWLESMGYFAGNPLDIAFDNVKAEGAFSADFEDGNGQLVSESGWGSGLEYTTYSTYALSASAYRLSYKVVANASKTLASVSIYATTYGTCPTYTLAIYADDGSGKPTGSPLVSQNFTHSGTSYTWKQINLPEFTWIEGETYHLVVQYSSGTIDSSNYLRLQFVGPNSVGRKVLRSTNSGSSWTELTYEPTFLLAYTDGSRLDQPYASYSSASFTTTVFYGQKFIRYSSLTARDISIMLRASATSATGAIEIAVRRWDDKSVVAIATKENPGLTTTFAWNTFTFNTPANLEAGVPYYFEVKRVGTGSGTYYVSRANTLGSMGVWNWGGIDQYTIYSSNSGGSWSVQNQYDLEFLFNGESWDRIAGAANWTVEGDLADAEWGSDLSYTKYTTYSLSTSSRQVSYKVTADVSKTLDKVSLYARTYGTCPTYTLAIYADDGNGKPTGASLVSQDFTHSGTSYTWKEIDIPEFAWTEGTVYHLVVQFASGTVASTNCLTLYYIGPDTEGRKVLTSTNGGSTWTEQTYEPTFIIQYTDGVKYRQPYGSVSAVAFTTTAWYGQKFTPPVDFTVEDISVILRSSSSSATGAVELIIRRWSDSNVVATATITTPGLTTSYAPRTFTFVEPVQLEGGTAYSFALKRATGSGTYYATRVNTVGSLGLLSWGGLDDCAVYSSNSGSTWSLQTHYDFGFTLNGEAEQNVLRVSRIGNDDNMLAMTDLTFSDGMVSADIRYNEQGPYFNDAELYFRFVDRDNFYKVGFRNFYGFWRIMYEVRHENESKAVGIVHEFSKSTRPVAGAWYNLAVEADGNDFTVYLDGVEVGSFSCDLIPSGGVAVGSSATQLGIWEPQKGYYFIDDDELSYYAPEGQPTPTIGQPLDLDWGYLASFFPTLILPGTYVMNDAEASNVVTWLSGGLRCLIATDGGIAMKNETGADDLGRIENLFGVANVVGSLSGVTGVTIGSDDHYVTLDYEAGNAIAASGSATVWPLVDEGIALATIGNGVETAPALIVNTITNDPLSPKKVFCFNFGVDDDGQLTDAFSQIATRAFQWARGEANKVRLELKYSINPDDPSLDLALLTIEGWMLSGSGQTTLIMDIPEDGIMTGDNLYWTLYAYAWDAADPWLAHGGFYSSDNDSGGNWVSLDGVGLQILGIVGDAYAGRDWDMWAAYNTRGTNMTVTFGMKEKGAWTVEDSFTDGDYTGWTITPHANISWSVTEGEALRADVVSTGGYAYITRDGLDVSDRNITIEYNVTFGGGAAQGGVIYRGAVLYLNPGLIGWEDDSPSYVVPSVLTNGRTHHVVLHIRDGETMMSDLYVDGMPVFLAEPIEKTSWSSTTVGFLSPYSAGYTEWDNVRLVDEVYAFASETVNGAYVPTNANNATFWPSIPDYDPAMWEFEGSSLGGAYEWYVYFRGAGIHSYSNLNVYFSPRLVVEDPNFPVSMNAGSSVSVPIEWEKLGSNLPAKMTLALQDARTGCKYVEEEFNVTVDNIQSSFTVSVPSNAPDGDDYMWVAYLHPEITADKWIERIGFDDTYRSDKNGTPIGPETPVAVSNPNGGEYVAYADIGIPAGSDAYKWGGSHNGDYTGDTPPEGVKCWRAYQTGSYAGWGVFYPNRTIDLSEFDTIKFWVKTAEALKIGVEAPKGSQKNLYLTGANWDPDRFDEWQEVTLPLSVLGYTNPLPAVYGPFMATIEVPGRFAVDFVNTNTGWAVGSAPYGMGNIRKTTDGGETWLMQDVGTNRTLYDVQFLDENVGYVTGHNTIRKTTDGGDTWIALTNNIQTAVAYYSASFINAQTGWVCASAGKILKTTDGGVTWTFQTSGTTEFLLNILFIDENNGWICGENGVILHTTNGGATWVAQSSGAVYDLHDLFFFDANNGWCVGDYDTLLKTTDGGSTWTTVAISMSISYKAIDWTDTSNGWMCGTGGSVLRTTDGGVTWINWYNLITDALYDIEMVGPDTGFVVGARGAIYRTTESYLTGQPIWVDMFPEAKEFLIDYVRWIQPSP